MKKLIVSASKMGVIIAESIKPSYNLIPDWYKKSKVKIESNTLLSLVDGQPRITYKSCIPFQDALTSGYMFILPADIEVIKENGITHFAWRSDGTDLVTTHGDNQWKNMLPCPDGYIEKAFKFTNLINLKAPRGYSALIIQPLNRTDLPFQILSGIVDIDTFNAPINFPFVIRENFSGVIPKGTPIAQIILFKREPWEMVPQEYSEEDNLKFQTRITSKIINSYREQFWSKKSYK
jgi:hypothetical protein